jgi:diguanylate cyclase (GGDEF)-like protein/PAS domain S-box-containing protein
MTDLVEPTIDGELLLRLTPRVLVDSFPNGALVIFDRDCRCVLAGGGGLAAAGLSSDLLEGCTTWEAFPAETAEALLPRYRRVLDHGEEFTFDISFDDHTYCIRVAPLRGDGDEIVGGIVATQDVTEARVQTEQLRVAEEHFRSAFEFAPIGMALVDLDGLFTKVNPALCEMLGYGAEDLLRTTFQDITHPDDLTLDYSLMERLLAGETSSYQMEKRYFDGRGHLVWAQLSVSLIRDQAGRPVHYVSQIEDISSRKRDEQQLTALAQRDGLTGLLNRTMLERELRTYERAWERYGDLCTVIVLDLDGFKEINDAHGHEVGDEVLREVAQAIRRRLRIVDHAFRFGGDEFAVLVPHTTVDSATVLADAIVTAIAHVQVSHAGQELSVTASAGLAGVRLQGGRSASLSTADAAMYAAKRNGGNRVVADRIRADDSVPTHVLRPTAGASFPEDHPHR